MIITAGRHILHLHFDLPAEPDAELPERLRRLLEGITPRVYCKRDAQALTEVVQLHALADQQRAADTGQDPLLVSVG